MSVTAAIAIVTVATAGAFAGPIAVALVGSNFAGLSGAALTSACLAYLGGGAIAAGGAVLGVGVGAGVGGVVGSVGLMGKKNTIMQSAKLLTSVREIFFKMIIYEAQQIFYKEPIRNILTNDQVRVSC